MDAMTAARRSASAAAASRHRVYLVSESSCCLLEHFFVMFKTQFPAATFAVESAPFTTTKDKILSVLEGIKEGLVCYWFGNVDLKALFLTECERRKLPAWDIFGPTLEFLQAATGTRANWSASALHATNSEYYSRMLALEFSLQHDDSRRIETLSEAEIVIAGVSRVSKSPNALYLAYRGFKVANVTIVPEQGLPPELERHEKQNVVVLTVEARRLAESRARRFREWNMGEMNYWDPREVSREVQAARRLYDERSWPVIDVTERAVEETGALILKALGLRLKVFEN
ncbi:MAG: kinase/pyrophosphorylase [Planctomycetes bacterium]|nr:kinase/pyrophosphorylase [Planctomycetota bacterium]